MFTIAGHAFPSLPEPPQRLKFNTEQRQDGHGRTPPELRGALAGRVDDTYVAEHFLTRGSVGIHLRKVSIELGQAGHELVRRRNRLGGWVGGGGGVYTLAIF